MDKIDQIFKDLFTASESLQRKTKAYDVEFILGHMFQEADNYLPGRGHFRNHHRDYQRTLRHQDYTYNFAIKYLPIITAKQLTLIDNEEQVQPFTILNRGYKLFIACETKEHYLNLSAEHMRIWLTGTIKKQEAMAGYKYKYKIVTGDEELRSQ